MQTGKALGYRDLELPPSTLGVRGLGATIMLFSGGFESGYILQSILLGNLVKISSAIPFPMFIDAFQKRVIGRCEAYLVTSDWKVQY